MFKKFLIGLRNLFTGASIENELEEYIISKHPTDASDVERLERQFWAKKARNAGYY